MHAGRFVTLLGTLVAATVAPPSVAAQIPPTLTGESFFVTAVQISSASCNPIGTSTFTYSASGIATGPYPGAFTEVGTIVIGAQNYPQFVNGFQLGHITNIEVFFTIDSPVGQVTGTKRLPAITPDALGLCYDFTARPLLTGVIATGTFRRACACALSATYEATIKTATGTFGDSGPAGLFTTEFAATVDGGTETLVEEVFNEVFVSSHVTPSPIITTGHTTGGGQLTGDVTFGFTAKSDENGLKAQCTAVDRFTDTIIKCLDATAFVQTGSHVTFSGNALVNGVPTVYTIDVNDVAEPGRAADTFNIVTTGGYSATGVLTHGNIQVHGQ